MGVNTKEINVYRRSFLLAAIASSFAGITTAATDEDAFFGPWDIVVYNNGNRRIVAIPAMHFKAQPGGPKFAAIVAKVRADGKVRAGESMGYCLEGRLTFGDTWRVGLDAGAGELGGP